MTPQRNASAWKSALTGPRLDQALPLCHALLLAAAGYVNSWQINPDGVAYLRLAGYYAQGDWQRAISGYWGAALSWLIAPLLKLGLDPLAAARVAMGLGAFLFALGSRSLLAALGLSPTSVRLGYAFAALASVAWSVEYISPDLWVSGLLCFGTAALIRPSWLSTGSDKWTRPLQAGLWLGAAYLFKSVALPLGLAFVLIAGLLWWGFPQPAVTAPGRLRNILRATAVSAATLLLVASPWIAVLSAKYHHFTFSTSAALAHAIVGPNPETRYHPTMRTLHTPEPGRLTSWEDPSHMPYRLWSPFDSPDAMHHQVALVTENAQTLADLLASLDKFHIGALGLLVSGIAALASRSARASGRWWWAVVLAIPLVGVYLPGYVQRVDQRYVYAALPLCLGSLFGLASWAAQVKAGAHSRTLGSSDTTAQREDPGTMMVWVCIVASFGIQAGLTLQTALTGWPNPGAQWAHVLADRLHTRAVHGPYAGSGLILGARTGILAAYLAGEQWLGDDPDAGPEAFTKAGARIAILAAGEPRAATFDTSPKARCLNQELFPSETGVQAPFKIYALEP